MKTHFRSRPVLAGAVASAAVVAGLLIYSPSQAGILDLLGHKEETPAAAAPAPAALNPAPVLGANEAPNYRGIIQKWGQSVVGITVQGTRKTSWSDGAGTPGEGDPFFQFFRGLPGFEGHPPRNLEQPFRGQGSGFIISADGLILTNAHVVRDAQEVTVKLADRREIKAKVLGADPATDIAVLRADVHGMAPVRFADPASLQVGDYVLAIGAPFGFEQSATAGIVSAKGRSLPGDSFVPFIQTDAAVNPGNSGGPLFDAAGDVVGINAQIYSQTGGYQGLSFAIPIDVALRTKDQIVATGHASHARLGVQIQDLNQALAESFGLTRPDGALVSSVDPDSAAAGAGIKAGDVITKINGTPVERGVDLSTRVGNAAPGTRVTLDVWRDHAAQQLSVKLGTAEPATSDQADGTGEAHGKLGLALRPLTPQERSAGHIDHGLVVEDAAGPAARAGMQPGDVLLGINGRPAESVEQVKKIVAEHPKTVALLIERDGQKIFVPVTLG
jgi:serine protease Do